MKLIPLYPPFTKGGRGIKKGDLSLFVIARHDRAIQKKGTGFGACPVLDTGAKSDADLREESHRPENDNRIHRRSV
jgi:hypothetical protein